MSHTVTRRIQFCAGHRVPLHESKCRHPHGHNYVAYITVGRAELGLDEVGRVLDFGAVKEIVGGWIDQHWDHGFIVQADDYACRAMLEKFEKIEGISPKLYIMEQPPTAECMAEELYAQADALLQPHGARVLQIVLHETENCYATWPRFPGVINL